MANEPETLPLAPPPLPVEMPRPTVAPLVLSLGVGLLGAGVVFNITLSIVGAVLLFIGLGLWIAHLLPGQGHVHEPRAADRPRPVPALPGTVEQMAEGLPGYRMQLPLKIHPISAGVKGGLMGGLLMPIPALLWGIFSGHGPWYPVNLLAGMVIASASSMPVADLEKFRFSLLLVGLVIHVIMSVVIGLIYGVLMPTLPHIHRPVAWGALLMPLLWSALSFGLMRVANPLLEHGVSWPWFIFSQFVFGIVAGPVVMHSQARRHPLAAGIVGGWAGGLLMAVPAMLWGLATRHGIWYPVNLLAGMMVPNMDELPLTALEQFRTDWFLAAVLLHAVISGFFGILYAFWLPKLPSVPTPLSWGGVLLPLLWTSASYGLMGVVNPLLQERVDWPWFIVSQFVFGVTAALVVVRTQTILIPPAGTGPSKEAAP